MKITYPGTPESTPASPPKGRKGKAKPEKQKNEKPARKDKQQIVAARTNKKPNLVELGVMRSHNFLSRT